MKAEATRTAVLALPLLPGTPPEAEAAQARVWQLLSAAGSFLAAAVRSPDDAERFRLAHLAALRTAAAVLAQRGRANERRRLVSVWLRLPRVAPEYADQATFFASRAKIRSAVESGIASGVSRAIADEEVLAARDFHDQVAAASLHAAA